MDIYSFILIVFWGIAGVWLVLGELPRFTKYHIDTIFGISDRRGKVAIGIAFITFCSWRLYQWYIDPSVTLELMLKGW